MNSKSVALTAIMLVVFSAIALLTMPKTVYANSCSNPCPIIGSFDSRSCYVFSAPSGATAFIYGGNFYVSSTTGTAAGCPSGTVWDSANCFISPIPSGTKPFVYGNNLYVQRSCDPNNWPAKTLNLEGVLIEVEKDNTPFNGRDDVSFVAMLHDKQSAKNCKPLILSNFTKVKKNQVGHWRTGLWSLVPSTQTIKPNQVVEFLLYDKDRCGSNCEKSFQTDCGSLYYKTRNTAYGSVTIPYGDFVGSNLTGTVVREYDLGDAKIRVKGFKW